MWDGIYGLSNIETEFKSSIIFGDKINIVDERIRLDFFITDKELEVICV